MDLAFAMPVFGRDGDEAGTLDRMLLDPDRREITHVVIKSPRVSEDVLVPLSLVQGNNDGGLLLHAAASDLDNMPRYYEGRTSSPPSGRIDTSVVDEPAERRQDLDRSLAVAADAIELGPDTEISMSGGPPAHLVGLTTDQYTNVVGELRVRAPDTTDDVRLPAETLDELRPTSSRPR